MTQVNLLPDVKQEYISAKRLQRTVMTTSILVAGGALAILIILFVSVRFIQTAQINGLNKDISDLSSDLKNIPDIDRILTVQAQLNALPGLHDKKPVAKRLSGFIGQVTPTPATISKLRVDFETSTMTIEGAADKLETVNKFADTLKFTNYKKDPAADETLAFSSVVLSEVGIDDTKANTVTYKISLSFAGDIFNSVYKELVLVVPSKVTTRSETQLPLFKPAEPKPAGAL